MKYRMGIFKKKNKLKEAKEVNLDKATSKEHETQQSVSSAIKVKVYRSTGGGGLSLAAKFQATERQDKNTNLFAINEEKRFKEDLDFTTDRVYDWINTDLALNGKKTSIKAEKVKEKIKAQEKVIKDIEGDVKLNAKYNFPDEEKKLKQYKIFLESLKKDKRGTYMLYEESGIRTYYFKSVDGILYPYWWGENAMRVDPDLTTAKKIFVHENMIFKNEHSKFQTAFNWTSIIMLVIGVLFLIGGAWLTYGHTEDMYSMAADVNEGNIKCTNTLALCTEKYEFLSSKCMLGMNSEENQKNINKKEPSNTNGQDKMNDLIKKIS